jgi:polar amino acid transport system substrate-binding protein
MRIRDLITYCAVAAITSAIVSTIVLRSRNSNSPSGVGPESAYQRILRTGKIRCGYVVYPPGLMKDANTGKLSGIFVDATNAAAANMGLRADWTEEVGWGSMIEGLRANRYDAICSPVWANSTRGKQADFSVPLFYSGIGAYVRVDDHRFDADLTKLNASGVTVATVDGEMSSIIAHQDFTKARQDSFPQLADVSQLLLEITSKKADVTFVEPFIAELFLKAHPGTLRNLAADHPLRIFPNTMMFGKDEPALKSMMDTALMELINAGAIDKLIRGYAPSVSAFYPLAFPYRRGTQE